MIQVFKKETTCTHTPDEKSLEQQVRVNKVKLKPNKMEMLVVVGPYSLSGESCLLVLDGVAAPPPPQKIRSVPGQPPQHRGDGSNVATALS